MGDSGSLQPHVDRVATSNKDVTADPANLMSKMDKFFMTKSLGNFSLSVCANLFTATLTCLVVLHCKKVNRRRHAREMRILRDKLNQVLENQAAFVSSQIVSSAAPSAASGHSAHPDTSTLAAPTPPSTSNTEELHSNTSLVAANTSHGEPPATSSEEMGGAYLRSEAQGRVRNGYRNNIHMRLRSVELCASSSSHYTSPSQDVKDHTVIDVSVLMALPSMADRAIGNELTKDVEDKLGVSVEHDTCSSRILQAKMKLTEGSLRALRDVAVKFMKLDKGFTLQFGGCYLYNCDGNPEEPVLLNLREVEVPTVLQADYSAGMLTIRGAYLKGAEFRATTSDGYMILKSITQDKPKPKSNDNTTAGEEIEVWKCTDPLPPCKLDQIKIFANKRVTIQGHDVTVRSEVTPIENIFWRTVFRNWLPTAILIVFLVSQVWDLVALICSVVEKPLHRFWLFQLLPACAIYVIQLLSARFEDSVKDFMERLKLAYSSFHVLPNLLDSPAFFMRNGLCYYRGAKYLVDSKLAVGGPDNQADPSPVNEEGQVSFDQEADPDQEASFENLPDANSEDWKRSCWKSSKKGKIEKIDEDSKSDECSSIEPADPAEPFSVIFFEGNPPNVRIYSKYLLRVAEDMLPNKVIYPSTGTSYGEICANDLFLQLIHNGALYQSLLDSEETEKVDRLHLRHLMRFLKKEYEEEIALHERMEKARSFTFTMLWTLFVPDVDVVHLCHMTNGELCGKVISTVYHKTPSELYGKDSVLSEFRIKLEVYDYDCVNFGAKTVSLSIYDFKGEEKAINMVAYPLRYKDRPLEVAEFFLNRGMEFYKLVLKHERRFMQYQGLMYIRRTDIPTEKLRERHWSSGNKESVDGRVMIDQGGFAKMKPNREMGTAFPSREWIEGDRSRMDQDEIEKIKPFLKYAPARVFGFSFSSRRWGCFNVEGFSEINFMSTAFDTSLVMKAELKKTLLTLSEHYIKEKVAYRNPDPLPNKGNGCIILLYGPPGTGKTLTAETLAEKLKCPLWQLSVSKLSASTKKLETKLLRNFEIAVSWRAILLLDEADVYLSSRKYSPLSSDVTSTNAMTGVFLRVLGYYKGILFLTTNVVEHFEDAIFSRMSLFVEFKEFDEEERKQLWTSTLNRVGFQGKLYPEFWKDVGPVRFNGRVIRNLIQNAQILAQSENKPLSEAHLLEAFHVMASPSARTHLIRNEEHYQTQVSQHDLTTGPAPSFTTESSGFRRAISMPTSDSLVR